jgi:hypothetical protein
MGFTGGVFDPPREDANPDFPYTLDLRYEGRRGEGRPGA